VFSYPASQEPWGLVSIRSKSPQNPWRPWEKDSPAGQGPGFRQGDVIVPPGAVSPLLSILGRQWVAPTKSSPWRGGTLNGGTIAGAGDQACESGAGSAPRGPGHLERHCRARIQLGALSPHVPGSGWCFESISRPRTARRPRRCPRTGMALACQVSWAKTGPHARLQKVRIQQGESCCRLTTGIRPASRE